jgi:hypothetical protein
MQSFVGGRLRGFGLLLAQGMSSLMNWHDLCCARGGLLSQLARHLLHPAFFWISGDASWIDTSAFQVDEEYKTCRASIIPCIITVSDFLAYGDSA